MRLLPDQGVPRKAADTLRAWGHDCVHVSEVGMHAATDEQIVELGYREDRVIITLDADFHALIAVRGLHKPSVIRLRHEGCRAELVVSLLQPVLFRYRERLERGCLISIRDQGTSVRSLPIG